MKKMLAAILTLSMTAGLWGCGSAGTKTGESQTPAGTTAQTEAVTQAEKSQTGESATENGAANEASDDSVIVTEGIDFKVGIMCSSVSQSEEAYRSAENLQKKYGEDVIVIDTFPDKAVAEQETTVSKSLAMAADPKMKVIVFNQAEAGTIAAINKVKEKRPDIYCITCNMNEDADEVAAVADLLITKDHNGLGRQVAERTIELGAKHFVHYSFPRHMSNQVVALRSELMKKICEENGIEFHMVTAPDPQSDAGVAGAQQFVLEDVPRKVKELGEDTVFFTTNISMNEPLIKAVMEQHAMFACQSDPSPFNAFPAALGINVPEDKMSDSDFMLTQIEEKVKEMGMSGRVSTWRRSSIDMYMQGMVAYGISHTMGLTNDSEGEVDLEYLRRIYTEIGGEGTEVNYFINGENHEYHHFVTLLGSLYKF